MTAKTPIDMDVVCDTADEAKVVITLDAQIAAKLVTAIRHWDGWMGAEDTEDTEDVVREIADRIEAALKR